MLYPLLHRLERLGHVESAWGASPTGRPRKHYRLSAAGAAAFAEQRRQWSVVSAALARVWGERGSGAPFALGGA
jgi:PadR family transcriptional regulator, regulatory protein PadR